MERPPPPALRWTLTSSRSICRSTRWKSSLHTLRPRLRTPRASRRTYIPIRAQGSQVSLEVVAAVMMVAASLRLCFYMTDASCLCVSTVNSWSGQHPYEWHCGSHTPREEYEDQTVPPAWPSQHSNQWVSSMMYDASKLL